MHSARRRAEARLAFSLTMLAAALLAAGCGRDGDPATLPREADAATVVQTGPAWDSGAASQEQRRRIDSLSRIPGYVIDSAIPIPEAIRRFQSATAAPRPAAFADGAASLDTLFARYVRALENGDTTAIAALVMNRSEFAWLYYPESEYPTPGYELSPDFVWFLLAENGARGMARARARVAGRDARVVGVRCEGPTVQGESRVWGPCVVALQRDDGRTGDLDLARSVIERDGRFKFASLANGL